MPTREIGQKDLSICPADFLVFNQRQLGLAVATIPFVTALPVPTAFRATASISNTASRAWITPNIVSCLFHHFTVASSPSPLPSLPTTLWPFSSPWLKWASFV
jgi:hypothetical protein